MDKNNKILNEHPHDDTGDGSADNPFQLHVPNPWDNTLPPHQQNFPHHHPADNPFGVLGEPPSDPEEAQQARKMLMDLLGLGSPARPPVPPKNTWLPATESSIFKDTWTENLKKSVKETHDHEGQSCDEEKINETCSQDTPDDEPWCMCGKGMNYGVCRDKDGNPIKNPRYVPLGDTPHGSASNLGTKHDFTKQTIL